jgi:transposase InsO family protein
LEKWAAEYKKSGLEALMPKERSDKGSVRALSAECMDAIFHIKEKYPRLGATHIHQRLLADGLITGHVSARTIQRFVKRQGLKGAQGIAGKERKAFEEAYFGAMWMADTCYFPYITEGGAARRTYLIAIIDDHSRLVVGATLYYGDTAYNFQKTLKRAVATYGIPNKLYVDHGPSYQNSQLPFICAGIGTALIHAPVRDGAAKGKVERTFSTFKTRWLHGLDTAKLTSLEEFNRELAEYVRAHNTTVNSATGQTPMDRFLATRERSKQPQSSAWLDECFMNRERRKVRNDATVSIHKIQFDAPMQFIGQTVEIRFLPDRMEDAYIFDAGQHYPLKPTDKQANVRVKRKNGLTVDYSKANGEA